MKEWTWDYCKEVSERPEVADAADSFSLDSTEDNAIYMVRTILDEFRKDADDDRRERFAVHILAGIVSGPIAQGPVLDARNAVVAANWLMATLDSPEASTMLGDAPKAANDTESPAGKH